MWWLCLAVRFVVQFSFYHSFEEYSQILSCYRNVAWMYAAPDVSEDGILLSCVYKIPIFIIICTCKIKIRYILELQWLYKDVLKKRYERNKMASLLQSCASALTDTWYWRLCFVFLILAYAEVLCCCDNAWMTNNRKGLLQNNIWLNIVCGSPLVARYSHLVVRRLSV